VRAPEVPQAASGQSQKSSGTVANNKSIGTVEWVTPTNAQVSDDKYTVATFKEAANSNYLLATNFSFSSFPKEAELAGVVVGFEKSTEGGGIIYDNSVRLVVGGVPVGEDKALATPWPDFDAGVYTYYGGSDDQWDVEGLSLATVIDSKFGVAISAKCPTPTKIAQIDHIKLIVYFFDSVDPNRICFVERSIEFRSDGVYRQGPDEDDVWGELVNEGFHVYSPPSYLEERAMRGLIIPSAGDLDVLADSGDHDLEAQMFYRPGYPFAREAIEV
jgi:hypothetical protein